MKTIVKCKECSYEGNIEDFPTTTSYSQDEDGSIFKDATFICPNCDAEGDQYFDIIEKNLNAVKNGETEVCEHLKTGKCRVTSKEACNNCNDYKPSKQTDV